MRIEALCVSFAALVVATLLPTQGFAQNTGIAGVVKDPTGAVLPGLPSKPRARR